ncbi:hypothetical protein K8S19_12900 [bacterium]|nr:hypothetical protein [bacterium]
MPEVIGVQLLKGGGVHYFLAINEKLSLDAFCVVEGEQGLQIARVVRAAREIPENRVHATMKRIVRAATGRDHEQLKKNTKKEQEAHKLCREKVTRKKMQMKLVDVSYTLDSRKAVFFFTAENRVDFRELVKELAQALKIKIEMRQIGVRDEARRLGGVGCCGRALCCATFLKDFASVSIRMAKEQNLSLNPTKVSGLCGRLMCCLAYEYEGASGKGKRKKSQENTSAETTTKQMKAPCKNCETTCREKDLMPAAETIKQPAESSPVPQPQGDTARQPNVQTPQNQHREGPKPGKRRSNFRRKGNRNHKRNTKSST